MPSFRPISDLKNNTNPIINSSIDSLTTVDELMPFIMQYSGVIDRISVKGEREVSSNGASVVGCDDLLEAAAISGAAYSYDLEQIAKTFQACYVAESDSIANEVQRNLQVAIRDVGEAVSCLAVADIEGQLTQTGTAIGSTFALGDLDNIYAGVKNKAQGSFVYFGDSAAVNEIIADMRSSLGGVTYAEFSGLQLPMYRGAPILTTDHATADKIVGVDFRSWQGYFNKLAVGDEVSPFLSLVDRGHVSGKTRREWLVGTLFTSVLLSTRNAVARTHA